MPSISLKEKTSKLVFQSEQPSKAKIFLLWFLFAILPIITVKIFNIYYIQHSRLKEIASSKNELTLDLNQFRSNLNLDSYLITQLESVNIKLKEKLANLGSLNQCGSKLIKSLEQAISFTPDLVFAQHLGKSKIFNFANKQKTRKQLLPGKRAAITILKYLQCLHNKKQPKKIEKKLYKQFSSAIFGSYVEPAILPGKLASGFTEKFNGDKIYLYHNFIKYKDSQTETSKIFHYLIVFRDSQIAQVPFLKWAINHAKHPKIQRKILISNLQQPCGISLNDKKLQYLAPFPFNSLLIGRHKNKDLFRQITQRFKLSEKPARSIYLRSSKNIAAQKSNIDKRRFSINLSLLIFAFASIFIVKRLSEIQKLPFQINTKLYLTIIFINIIPFGLFYLISSKYVEYTHQVRLKNLSAEMEQNLHLFELNITNKQKTFMKKLESFNEKLREINNSSPKFLKKFIDSKLGIFYSGYTFTRNDGISISNLKTDFTLSAAQKKSSDFLRKLLASMAISYFHYSNAETPKLKKFLNTTEGRVVKIIATCLSAMDLDTFAADFGTYFSNKYGLGMNYRVVTFNHQPGQKNGKPEPWYLVTFLQNNHALISNFFEKKTDSWKYFLKRHENTLIHTSVFKTYNSAMKSHSFSKAWPKSSFSDLNIKAAANEALRSTKAKTWLKKDTNGNKVLYSSRKISGTPFVAISNALLPEEKSFASVIQIFFLLFSLYFLGLISLIGYHISNLFVLPIRNLLIGINELKKQKFPQLKVTGKSELSRIISEFNKMVTGIKERQKLERFVSGEVIEEIKKESELNQQTKAKIVEKTILFAHIRNFDSLISKLSAKDTVRLLNLYFEHMEPAITSSIGVIDKYIGDAIMATFTTTRKSHDFINSANAAIKMLKALKLLNSSLKQNNLPQIKLGIGINKGKVVSGKIGSHFGRKDFTVIGDSVNIAARLESISHFDKNSHIMISEKLAQDLKAKFKIRFHEEIKLKGKTLTEKVFELSSKL